MLKRLSVAVESLWTCTQDGWGAEGIHGRVQFLLLAWARMPKTSYRKNSDSLVMKNLLHLILFY